MKTRIATFIAVVALAFGVLAGEPAEWVSLFDGQTLNGWTQLNGKAAYEAQAGTIVGRTAEGSPNSFLCSDKHYGDFELEFEVNCERRLNSGVQIRSLQKGGKPGGRIYGPQVEIAPGKAGFIYGEATGLGWLSPEPRSKDPKVSRHPHFKSDQWNHYRVIAQGSRIQTFINGHKIADLTHDGIYKTHPKGVIGLQVHSIRKGTGPYQVAWRNIRIRELK